MQCLALREKCVLLVYKHGELRTTVQRVYREGLNLSGFHCYLLAWPALAATSSYGARFTVLEVSGQCSS